MFTCCPGRLRPGSEGTRGRPALPGDSVPSPSARSVNQQSHASRAQFQSAAELTSCAWRLGPVNEHPWCRPDFQGDSGRAPRAHSVDQFSQATRALVRVPAVSTSYPGDSGQASTARGVYHLSRGTPASVPGPAGSKICHRRLGPESEALQGRPAVPGDSHSCLRTHRVDQLSRETGP